jgi:hypothetical protein
MNISISFDSKAARSYLDFFNSTRGYRITADDLKRDSHGTSRVLAHLLESSINNADSVETSDTGAVAIYLVKPTPTLEKAFMTAIMAIRNKVDLPIEYAVLKGYRGSKVKTIQLGYETGSGTIQSAGLAIMESLIDAGIDCYLSVRTH